MSPPREGPHGQVGDNITYMVVVPHEHIDMSELDITKYQHAEIEIEQVI